MDGQLSFESAEDPMFYRGPARGRWGAGTVTMADEKDLNRHSRGDEANETSRFLAANTQLDLDYAATVKRLVIAEPFRALAPVYGADPAVIARWALSALRREFWRNVALTLLFAVAAVLFPVLWIGRPWQAGSLAFAIVLAVAVIAVVTAEQFQIQRVLVTLMLRDEFSPADAPEPKRQVLRDMLAATADPADRNLVIFQKDSPFPFVGSGRQEYHWHLAVDVSHGKKTPDGTRQEPTGFTSAELHAEIIRELSNTGLRYVRVGERLFVSGRDIQDNPGLLPGWTPPSRPPARVDDDILTQAVCYPTPDARVFICAEMPGWEGQLVITLFVRAIHAGGTLDLEWSFHVLPPLTKLLPDIDGLYRQPVALQLLSALGRALLRAVPYFLLSPLALAGHGKHKVDVKAGNRLLAWKIRRGLVFDFGAEESIREAKSGFGSHACLIEHDQIMAVMVAQETLLQAVRNFLDSHGVDLTEFEGEVQVVTYSTEKKYNRGSVATGIVVGDMSTMNDAGSARPRPGPAAGTGG